jgi:general secretion pathway protein H
MRPSRHAAGISLIELLVVVAVLAVLAGAAAIGLAGLGGGRETERETRALAARIELACERAQLSGRFHGLHLAAANYAFSQADASGWKRIDAGELRDREWPRDIRIDLRIAGRPVDLPAALVDDPTLVCSPAGELSEFEARIETPGGGERWRLSIGDDGRLVRERIDLR